MLFLDCGGCYCLGRVLLSVEGGFAGFSADYLTESPSRDEIALPSRVGIDRIGSVYRAGGCYCPWKAQLFAFLPLSRQNRPPETVSPSGLCFWAEKFVLFSGCGGCYCLGRVLLSVEGGFAGFSADYLTESPSRDETTLSRQYRPPNAAPPSRGKIPLTDWWLRGSIPAWTEITYG